MQNREKNFLTFSSWLPSTFNFGPAEAVKEFKDPSWLEKINRLETFEDVKTLAKQAFKIHTDQVNQLECLDLIITNLINRVPHDTIMKKIRKI